MGVAISVVRWDTNFFSAPFVEPWPRFFSPEAPRTPRQATSDQLFRPSHRDMTATDGRKSSYFGVLNKIYLQNFLHGRVVNHETNLMSIFNS